jgi:hypothetical protein
VNEFPKAVHVPYEIAMQRLQRQLDSVDKLDAKIATTIGFAGAVLSLFSGLLGLQGRQLPAASTWCIGLAFVTFVLMLVLSVAAYRTTAWDVRPPLDDLLTHSKSFTDDALRVWAAQESARAVRDNHRRVQAKASYVFWVVVLGPVSVLFVAIAGMLSLVSPS